VLFMDTPEFFRQENIERLSYDLISAVTENILRTAIEESDHSTFVGRYEGVGRIFEDLRK